MPTVTVSYVYFGGGSGHTRQPRNAQTSGFIPFPGSPATFLATAGQQLGGYVLPQSFELNGENYGFAFVNVTGGMTSPVTSYNTSEPPVVTVGNQPISVLVVYVPEGGGGPPGDDSGASIDSFDITTNMLINPNFVTVATDGNADAGKTNSGNVDGWVDTWESAESITALLQVNPPTANFIGWVDLLNPTNDPNIHDGVSVGGPNNTVLTVDRRIDAYALAYYQNPLKLKDHKEFVKEHKEFVKEFKENLKELVKETFKETHKEADKTVAQELPGGLSPGSFSGDPGLSNFIVNVLQRIEGLESQVLARIESFIRPAERPPVGEQIREDPDER